MYTFSFVDLIPYIIVLLYACFFNLCKIKSTNSTYAIYIVLLLFSALRFDVGWDYEAYVPVVEQRVELYRIENVEWLSKIIMSIAYKLNFTQLFFMINSLVAIYPIYYVSKRYSVLPVLSIYLFLCDPIFFINGLSIVRNASAFSLVFLAYHFLRQKKYLFAVISVLIAGGFHSSGYIGFILIFLNFIKLNRIATIIIFISSFFISEVFQQIIGGLNSEMLALKKLASYAAGEVETGPFLKIIIYGVAIFHLIFWKKLVAINKNNEFLIVLVCIGASIWSAMSFASTISFRFCIYFFLFNILLIPNYLYIDINYRKIVHQIILLGFGLYFLMNIGMYVNAYLNGSEKIGFIPYKLFFNQDYSQFNL